MRNRIAVIGTINKDTIHLPSGETRHSYGGLLYSIISLAQILKEDDQIYPILNLGRDCQEDVLRIIARYSNIKTEHIRIVDAKNNHCHLFYHDRDRKSEILEGGVPPLRYQDVKAAHACDLVMVNFISGCDVGLRALEKFRAEYIGPIYMDIHSLTLGLRANGERYLRKPANWQRYTAIADYLQMNSEEYELLTGFGPKALTLKVFHGWRKRRTLIVTMGREGALVGYKMQSGAKYDFISAPKIKQAVDTTGCGDVFGAAFAAMILEEYSPEKAVRFANLQASRKCRYSGIEDMKLSRMSV
jgi:sugar/nucleoside kinase (ribokinase family)